MRISANLASRPFIDVGPILRRLRIAVVAMILLSIGLGAGLYALHAKAAAVRAREHSLDADLAGVRGEEQGYETLVRQPNNATVLEHAATLNKLFDAKTFSWTLAMENLETVLPGGVQVSTLVPIRDPKDGHITLHMRVVGPRDKAVELVQNLERSRRFMAPRITGEASENAGNNANQIQEPVGPTNRVTFDLMADYNPAAPDERRSARKQASLEDVSTPVPAVRHRAQRVPGPQGQPVPQMPTRKTLPPPQGGPR